MASKGTGQRGPNRVAQSPNPKLSSGASQRCQCVALGHFAYQLCWRDALTVSPNPWNLHRGAWRGHSMELGAVWGAVQQGWPHPSRVLVFLYVRDASTAIAPQGSSQVRAQMSAWKCPVRCSIGILMLSCHRAIIKPHAASLMCSWPRELYKT